MNLTRIVYSLDQIYAYLYENGLTKEKLYIRHGYSGPKKSLCTYLVVLVR